MERTDLNDIALFAATVQAGSLSRAAEQLCLPKSRLSRRLTALEESLGSKLMDRTRSGVRLNELGEGFYRHARMMLDCAEQAVGSVRQSLDVPQGVLRLSVSVEIQRALLEPHLADYLRRYPDVALEVVMDNRRISLIQDGIDVALRVGEPAQDDVVARHIASFAFGLYASADYLAARPPLETPEHLAQHPLLHKFDGADALLRRGIERYHLRAKKRVSANDAFLLARLAAAGEGIALLPDLPALTAGLTRVLPEWATEALPLHALYYKNRGFAPTVRSFIDWLAAVVGQGGVRRL